MKSWSSLAASRVVLLAASLLLGLSACHGGSSGSGGPAADRTLAPGAAFRDGLLYAAIKAKLAGMDIDSTTRISVAIHGGNVILRGNVKDRETKARDVKLVREIRGVRAVDDQLRVGHVGKSLVQGVRDAGLVAAVAGSLTAQTGVNVGDLRIDANDGTVTLTGHAPSGAIKTTMLAATRKTPGVRNVVDRIAVR